MPFDRDRLKGRRIDMGITLQEVADFIGVEKPTVQRYESGKINRIDTMTVEKLARAINCNPAYLMGWQAVPQVEHENNYSLNAHEKTLITAYRKTSDMRAAVDRILNIVSECEHVKTASSLKEQANDAVYILPVSARSGEQFNVKTTKSKIQATTANLKPSEYEQEADEFAKMAREQFLLEKKQEEKAYFAKKLDAG